MKDQIVLPERWPWARVDRVASVNARIGWKALTASEYVSEGVAFLATPDIASPVIDYRMVNRIPEWRYEESPELKLREGDVLLSKDGTLGVTRVIGDLPERTTVNGSIAVLRPSGIESGFLKYWLESSFVQAEIEALRAGMGVPHLFQWDIKRISVPLPPAALQRAIADFLDAETARIDVLIDKKRRMQDLLDERGRTATRSAVTHGLDSDVPLEDSGHMDIGPIPRHWKIARLSSLCGFQPGRAHEPFVDEDGEYVCVNSRYVSTDGRIVKRCTRNLSPAKKSDILMVMSDLPNGRALAKAFLVKHDHRYAVNQRVCIISPRKIDPRFAYYQLNRSPLFLRHDDGSSQTHLSSAVFTSFPLLVPPRPEQEVIADYLDRLIGGLTAASQALQQQASLLRERRQALITAAVTGVLEIPGVAA